MVKIKIRYFQGSKTQIPDVIFNSIPDVFYWLFTALYPPPFKIFTSKYHNGHEISSYTSQDTVGVRMETESVRFAEEEEQLVEDISS